jgi:hypothetical protein
MSEAATVEKKTKKSNTPPAGNAAGAAKAREAKDAAAAKDVFTYVGEPKEKVAPQAMVIIATIKAAGKKGINRDELVQALSQQVDGKPVLVTKQPVSRILSYYQKLIVNVGAVEVAKAA